ncbi:MAG: hypothetical protein H9W81_13580 [Enterococcus sp.]|nr:hypothetical protein [Enterococcus sp.]
MSAENTAENLYPTDLSAKFQATGGSEYHILKAINEIKDALGSDEQMVSKLDWVVTQLGNLAYTAGVEISDHDIDALVDAKVEEQEYIKFLGF